MAVITDGFITRKRNTKKLTETTTFTSTSPFDRKSPNVKIIPALWAGFNIDIQRKLLNILKNKSFFVLLLILLLLLTGFLFWQKTKVKGRTSGPKHVIIWLDNERLNLISSSEDPSIVLKENNITVYPEDIVTSDLILDPVLDGGAGLKIAVKRAPVYYIEVDGKTIDVRTWEGKVSEIITKGGVNVAPKDILSSSLESSVTPGATIIVTRVKEADIDIFEEVPFETLRKGDTSVPFGTEKVTQEGEKGKIKKTYRITYKNGVEVSRRLLSRETVTVKKDKVIAGGILVGRANFGYYSGMVTSFFKGMTGKYLLVTNLANGKQVRVKIIGSGPFNGPLMDMGTEPFQAIGGRLSDGYIPKVSVQLVD